MKADLADGRLALSAALFEITKTNARIPDPANPGFNTLGGEQRMRGVSSTSREWSPERLYLASGYAYLDSEVVRGANAAAVGAPIANAPEHSANRLGSTIASRRVSTSASAPATSASSSRKAPSTGA